MACASDLLAPASVQSNVEVLSLIHKDLLVSPCHEMFARRGGEGTQTLCLAQRQANTAK